MMVWQGRAKGVTPLRYEQVAMPAVRPRASA